MTDDLLIAGCLATAVTVVFYMLPAAGKYAALYGLHGVRDRLYVAARANPQARNTAIYRDAEFFLTSLIYIVRDQGYRQSLWVVINIMMGVPDEDYERLRKPVYDKERATVFATVEGQETLSAILATAHDSRSFALLYAVAGHPLVAIPAIVGAVAVIPILWGVKLVRLMSPDKSSPSTELAAAVGVVRPRVWREARSHDSYAGSRA